MERTEITRINRTNSYKILKRTSAGEVGSGYELDPTYRNCYFLLCGTETYEEPKSVRSHVYYLKSEIPDKSIYLLSLQSTDVKVIKPNKQRKKESEDVRED